MRAELNLISPLPPSVNNYLNYRVVKAGRRFIVQSYPTAETKKYQKDFSEYVKNEMENQGWVTPNKDKLIYIEMVFYLDRKKKDPNNFFKVPLDVLTDCSVYVDDDNVLPVTKRLYIDKFNPRIELKIYSGEEIGIFDNQNQYQSFIHDNCRLCSKNVENCVIMRKLLENRLVEEVENMKLCKKRKTKCK